jgi:DNA-binding ferritin-like protein (Dps family)
LYNPTSTIDYASFVDYLYSIEIPEHSLHEPIDPTSSQLVLYTRNTFFESLRTQYENNNYSHLLNLYNPTSTIDYESFVRHIDTIEIPHELLEIEDYDERYLQNLVRDRDLGIYEVENYEDLQRLFETHPTIRLRVIMYSGQEVIVSKWSFEQLLDDYAGTYDDSKDYNSNFRIVGVLRYNQEEDERVKQHVLELKSHNHQPELFGIDDYRFSIEEKHVPGEYYCPTNGNCVYKCIVAWFRLNEKNIDDHPELAEINFNRAFTIPQVNSLLRKQKSRIRVISYSNKDTHYKNFIAIPIYKYEIREGYFHSVLILDPKKYRKTKPIICVDYRYTNIEDLNSEALQKLEGHEVLKKSHSKSIGVVKYFAFDFETYKGKTRTTLPGNHDKYLYEQTPYMLQWGNVNHTDHEFDLYNPKRTVNGKFLKFLTEKLKEVHNELYKRNMPKAKREVIMFSYNGALFDNFLMVDMIDHPDWRIKSRGYLGDEKVIKKFSIVNRTLEFYNEVSFLDIRLFFPPDVKLEEACKTYNCTQLKDVEDGFDIKDYMTRSRIIANRERIVEYGLQDVRALYELAMKHKRYLKEVSGKDVDMFSCVSIANYASTVRDLYMDKSHKIYYNPRDEIAEFERECVRGGRVFVGQVYCDKPTVAADANGLYSSAMAMNDYPCGRRYYYNRRNDSHLLEEIKDQLNNGTIKKHYELKIKYKIHSKCLIPLLPIQNDKNPKGLIKTGCFTSVDVLEAVKYGKCEVLEVMFAIAFENSAPLFKEFVDVFFEKRANYKKRMKDLNKDEDKDEYKKLDVLQNLCKLIVNSSYGSLLLKKFEWEYSFISEWAYEKDADPEMELVTMCGYNRQQYFVRRRNRCSHDNTRPLYLGAFILSYSKSIMNKIIAAVDGFWIPGVIKYGDTDSLYVSLEDYNIVLKQYGYIGDGMGQCKNDNDDNIIDLLICLGKKLKIAWLDNNVIKSTIKGYKGLKKIPLSQKYMLMEKFMKQAMEPDLDKPFEKITYESMERYNFHINTISCHRNFKVTVYDQYQVRDGICYPLYYRF